MPPTPVPLNCTLACACATAYGINPVNGQYAPVSPFSGIVNFNPGPAVINGTGSDRINACLVGKNSNGIIVAFRGTIPPGEPDSLPDWLVDFFAEPTTCGALPGLVHSGFCHDINSIIEPIVAAVKALDPSANKVYVTGHSKGGALASLGAYLLTTARVAVQQVVTFASPRTGDPDFRAGYQKVIPNQIRYENYGDLVPLVPPSAPFIGGLGAIVSRIPDIGKELAAIIDKAKNWEYVPVGAEYFIESASDGYAIDTSESELDQVGDFFLNLAQNDFDIVKALGNAHAIACDFGYMSGSCPSSVCGGTS
ncbi:putative Class 3 lipase [Candidatus Sulfopaludibacter sp. SbA4]|nr:putative Class 3 lipase [Candidatus Sulfopaludibacter sp. SbA4]